jgi:hypothetical protein
MNKRNQTKREPHSMAVATLDPDGQKKPPAQGPVHNADDNPEEFPNVPATQVKTPNSDICVHNTRIHKPRPRRL